MILMQLRDMFCEEECLTETARKCKAESPLTGSLKYSEPEENGTVSGDGVESSHIEC